MGKSHKEVFLCKKRCATSKRGLHTVIAVYLISYKFGLWYQNPMLVTFVDIVCFRMILIKN